jgi:DNA-binding NtrC family response regulator
MFKNILLLEDQNEARRGLARVLRLAGHQVQTARNVLEAQVLCAMEPFDVAIVDVNLPGLHGDEWALYLKDLYPDIRIIFVSGRAGLAGLDRFGPDVAFLQKPIDSDELLDLLADSAGKHAAIAC